MITVTVGRPVGTEFTAQMCPQRGEDQHQRRHSGEVGFVSRHCLLGDAGALAEIGL